MTDRELNLTQREFNATTADYPRKCAHELFELQVERDPDATAVLCGARRLSYRELNSKANQVAHFLRKQGVGPETLVAVCVERSPEMVIALLGVWKSGGAYVPLDPAYPRERLAFMCSDSAAQVILTDHRCRDLLPESARRTICVDSDWPVIATESDANPSAVATPANLAYVMYTSGSTGRPKGAMILHSGLVNYLWWAIRTYGVKPGGSVPVHSSISFDLTVTSLYTPLLAGGEVELLTEEPGGQHLLAALRHPKKRSLVKITPAHLDMLNQMLSPGELAGVTQAFIIGGEALLADPLRRWREFAPATRLINEYGPTETVVGCCTYEVQPGDAQNGPIAIGRPIANTQLYVLDSDLRPVTFGDTGELYVAGAGVARGYLNQPELTRERFLPNPFSSDPTARMYKTGDLARYRADGVLEYLGRIDNQVKVLGYRVELGEIEASLAAHPVVHGCVVMAREDTPGSKQLVAYVVAHKDENPTSDILREFLSDRLPAYMVPARFVFLKTLPINENGKVDRTALPAPAADVAPHRTHFAAPSSEVEKQLASIWSELLNVQGIGINDDFFDLGGHSLMAIKALARIRSAFGVDVPMQVFFNGATISELAKALGQTTTETTSGQHIERRGQSAGPLSYAQEQLWYLYQLAPNSPVYNVVDAIDFPGEYDREAMKKALNELLRRHEALRTSFREVEGQVLQFVSPTVELDITQIDLSSIPESKREEECLKVVRREVRQPFDLSQAPLLRAVVVHLGNEQHRLLLTVHHIVSDEWSMEVVHRELGQLYSAIRRGTSSPLAELPIQYSDFAAWQREWLTGELQQKQIAYWKNELAGCSTVLDIHTDRPRPAVQSFEGGTESFAMSREVLQQLRSLAQKEQSTLFMTLEACFAALLHRYTGQGDILVGTPMSNRKQAETQDLVGCFINTVVLRTQVGGRTSFRGLLQQVRERTLGSFDHSDLPFERLVSELTPARDMSRTPLFQVMFILHDFNGVSQVSKVSGNRDLHTGTSKFDLTLVVAETPNGLEGLIEYNTALFEAHTVQRLCERYEAVIRSVVRNPDHKIALLPIVTDDERQKLLSDWNDTVTEFHNADLCLHELIDRQSQRTPDKIAVTCNRDTLSYAALVARADELAARLRNAGVGPDVLVGFLAERSVEMVIGVLGILKAGGAYVPLDPSFPSNRLQYMVENSKMQVLVCQRGLESKLAALPRTVVHLDSDAVEFGAAGHAPAEHAVTPQNLAYVLYTSGSTGKPKGVKIPHSALVNFLLSMQREPGFCATDTLLAVTTLSFDIAGLELYLPLISGGKVVVATREEALDPGRLIENIDGSGCTVLQATPGTWRSLIHAGWKGSKTIRALCGGEAMDRELAQELLPRCGELWNMYGPTETAVWSTIYKVTFADISVPIGRPIANTQIYVLDANRALLPPGVVGELYIGGAGLAHGYLFRDELTQERFVANPFVSNARMYRTGDLAYWRSDGTLECLGRVDSQVKIRGYRVELGEIEGVLDMHVGVRKSVLVAREDVGGEKQLVAYFETRAEAAPAATDLRKHLEQELPSYMVPSHFVSLDKFPMTPNGKIDRNALPAPSRVAGEMDSFVPPRDAIEQLLARIWTKLLRLERVGIHDNFFEAGGHSLLAVRLMVEVEKLSKMRLPLATLLQSPTIAEFAEILRGKQWSPSWSSLVPIRPGGSKPPLFLFHAHGGNVLEYYPLANKLDSDQPVYAFQAKGLDGNIVAGQSMQSMAAAYVSELQSLQPEGPYWLGGFCFGGLLALEAACQLTDAGHEVALLMLIQSMHPFAMRFAPHATALHRFWYRTTKRLDLELDNLQHRRNGDLRERIRYAWNRAAGRAALTWDKLTNANRATKRKSLRYILEALADEHTRVIENYVPSAYEGKVLLFRASRQLKGQLADTWLGWRGILKGNVEVCELPGHQQQLLLEPAVSKLAAELAIHLSAEPKPEKAHPRNEGLVATQSSNSQIQADYQGATPDLGR